ncbi:bacillithiol biosynthesis cysteine-adding enzyme BshC [Halalkalibacter urbisdiaboli]|uniref:bacillithiol biosynthesis cysteine-adding enzyme BshC n=1 Tax=Halalkalibacter urbisdiaboli TaxID=1960589 RepID=UPI000B450AEF|nr:bacillithiol biosynthesis cysteine-adding enzyme BshC [Halalkalibacter urbisdiaboli]
MEVKEVNLAQSAFVNDYLKGKVESNQFFDYPLQESNGYQERIDELSTRHFKRAELVEHLLDFHKQFPNQKRVINNIKKLQNSNAVTVVGGQQAGLLTGPLYTLYKAMSIIILAKQQEEALGVPVVPIFWIAGEDHDLEEIRFVYAQKNKRWSKHVLNQHGFEQKTASDTEFSKQNLSIWIDDLFQTFPETANTKRLVNHIHMLADCSHTYVDFFAQMMNWFFEKEGLVLLDSNHQRIREIEADYFIEMIEHVSEIQKAQLRGVDEFASLGYGTPIETEPENAHLFIQIEGERKRLDFLSDFFQVRGTNLTYTKNELKQMAKENPSLFSNNVVSRPIMQEFLLPVLAFVSGPGELAYWATLKHVFHCLSLKVPRIVLRLQATVIPREVHKWVGRNGYTCMQFLEGEGEQLKNAWLASIQEYPINDVMKKMKVDLADSHQKVQELAGKMDTTLFHLSQKNFSILNSQVEFMERKMNQFVEQKHHHMLAKFDEVNFWLFPENRLQERVIHPVLLLNLVGEDGLRRFIEEDFTLNGKHKLIYL